MAKSAFIDSFLLTLSNHKGASTGPVEPVNSISKDVCGAKLLLMTSLPILLIVSVSVTYLRLSTAIYALMEGITHF